MVLFEEGEHDGNKKYFYGGQYFCKNIFNPLVKANRLVGLHTLKTYLTYISYIPYIPL